MQPIREWLNQIAQHSHPDQAIALHAYRGWTEMERAAFVAKGYGVYAGKVRELLRTDRGLYIYHTDRLSAFDRFVAMVPYKGTILAEISQYWLEAVGEFLPTHYLARPHERVLHCLSCKPLKVEVVVRGYLAGSMMRAYEKGERKFCGVSLPSGLEAFRPLPTAIITPTTKAEAFEHDEDSSPQELIAKGICTADEWEQIETIAFQIFKFGQEKYAEKGWILVDTKYEFGKDDKGQIRLIDEVHTPDSSRLWVRANYEKRLAEGQAPEMLDKENVRRYLLDQGFSGHGPVPEVPVQVLIELAKTYLHVAETLSSRTLLSDGPEAGTPKFSGI